MYNIKKKLFTLHSNGAMVRLDKIDKNKNRNKSFINIFHFQTFVGVKIYFLRDKKEKWHNQLTWQ
jgi:hypothetical protein